MTRDADYAPFPTDAEMIALEELLTGLARIARSPSSRETYEKAATVARNARLGHTALHERYLHETTEYKAALGKPGAVVSPSRVED